MTNALEEKIENKLKTLDPQIELRLRSEPRIARAMMDAALLQWTKEFEQLGVRRQ